MNTLSDQELQTLSEYMTQPYLQPELDKAFRLVYANNVKQIVQATALGAESIWDKISKLMPAIVIIATGLFIVFALYGFSPIIQAEFSHFSSLTVTCVPLGTSVSTNATHITATTTIPSGIHLP